MAELETASKEGEVDLFQYWSIIEKQWKLILGLSAVAVVTAMVISLYLPKVYCVTATISQGRVVMGERGEQVASATNLADIQQMMGTGSFIKSVLSALKLDEVKYGPSLIQGIVSETKERSENILIRYETSEPDLGIKILDKVIAEIQKTFNQRVVNYTECKTAEVTKARAAVKLLQLDEQKATLEIQRLTQEIAKKEQLAKINTTILTKEKVSIAEQISRLIERIKAITAIKTKLSDMSATFEPNTLELLKGKTWLTSHAEKGDALISILYANNIQQNLNFLALHYERMAKFEVDASEFEEDIVRLKNQSSAIDERIKEIAVTKDAEVKELNTRVQEARLRAERIVPAEMDKMRSEVVGLEAQKNLIEGVTVISAPDYVNAPIRPKRRIIAASTGGIALCVGIFLAYFLEWRRTNEERLAQIRKSSEYQNVRG